jgi:glutamyl-tRNA synthetase
MSVRVRYAPSPTGQQHIGGLRTALFNYLFAKSQGGKFILRIEDTDQSRYNPEAEKDLYETLQWVGISWDEGPEYLGKYGGGDYGPYVQSQRQELYKKYAQQLLDEGKAYRCFCTPERLDQVRKEQEKNKSKVIGYDRHCRNLSPEEVQAKLDAGEKHVIRFAIPLPGKTEFHDQLLGRVKRDNHDINPDPVILKSDGFPTYHLANVIDDHLMGITHVLRAQEWVSSGPLHVLLYQAFGWEPPVFVHLPMVLGKDKAKLSKRHGSTSVVQFKEAGYLPEAILNYVSLLGWSLDDSTEFFTQAELEKVFSIERLNKASAVFDYKKLDWFNGQYIRKHNDADLLELLKPYLEEAGFLSSNPSEEEKTKVLSLMPLVKERLKLLPDVVEVIGFLFREIDSWDPAVLIPKKMTPGATIANLETARELLQGFETRSPEANDEAFHAACEERGIGLGKIMMPLRVATTGTKASPPLFESLLLLGPEKTYQRIDGAIQFLKTLPEDA